MSFRTTILVAPIWPAQPWYTLSLLLQYIDKKSSSFFLEQTRDYLQLLEQDLSNSRVKSHETSCYSPSGWGVKDFQETFPTSFTHPGGSPPLRVTRQHESDGLADAVGGGSTFSLSASIHIYIVNIVQFSSIYLSGRERIIL